MKIADRFLSAKLRADEDIYRRARLIILVDLLYIFATTFVLIPIFYMGGFLSGCWITIIGLICASTFLPLMYYSGDIKVCGHYFAFCSCVIMGGLMAFSGGIHSPFLFWFLTIPPISHLYMKRQDANVWTFITAMAAVMFLVMEMVGFDFPTDLNRSLSSYFILLSFMLIMALFVTVVRSFKKGYKKMNSKLEGSNEELKKSNEELERFAFIASHDLKTPLRNIVSFVNLFNRKYNDHLDETGREYIQFVTNNARQMHLLIEDILEYSRTSNHILREEKVDMGRLLGQIARQLQTEEYYPHSQIHIADMPNIKADSSRIHQLFQNLIENGVKYNDSETPSVFITFYEDEGFGHFVVRDNGIGIESDYQEQIFEMFRRLHNQDRFPGTGIGLSICKKIMQAYKGHIRVESMPGQGTAFYLSFPLQTIEKSQLKPDVHSQAELINS